MSIAIRRNEQSNSPQNRRVSHTANLARKNEDRDRPVPLPVKKPPSCPGGFVDGAGKPAISYELDDAESFSEGLAAVRREDLSDPPGNSPQFAKVGAWSTAAWSDGEESYLLATQADPDALKQLL